MKNIQVIIDNGHGADTKGKCSPDKSIYEWEYCRDIAKRLQEALTNEGIKSVLLVPEDDDIKIGNKKNTKEDSRVNRCAKYNKSGKNKGLDSILVSVHLNACGCGNWYEACGWTGWIAPNASDDSKLLAQCLYEGVDEKLAGNRCVPAEKYWVGDFAICRETPCPAVLTENLFQDNHNDVDYLLSEEGKQAIVNLHVNGIKKYISL